MSGGCTGHSHDHDHEDQLGLSLQKYIDIPQTYCLNEHVSGAGQAVLKPYSDRLTTEPSLQSPRDDDDLELLMHIPFTEAIKIQSISISGRASIYIPNGDDSNATSAPFSVKVFANRSDLDFEMARDLEPDVLVELLPPEHLAEIQSRTQTSDEELGLGTLDYPLRPASKFKFCNSITLFFADNFASKLAEAEDNDPDDIIPTEITYIGFKVEGMGVKRVAVDAVYETRGMMKDHTVPEGEFGAESKPGI